MISWIYDFFSLGKWFKPLHHFGHGVVPLSTFFRTSVGVRYIRVNTGVLLGLGYSTTVVLLIGMGVSECWWLLGVSALVLSVDLLVMSLTHPSLYHDAYFFRGRNGRQGLRFEVLTQDIYRKITHAEITLVGVTNYSQFSQVEQYDSNKQYVVCWYWRIWAFGQVSCRCSGPQYLFFSFE